MFYSIYGAMLRVMRRQFPAGFTVGTLWLTFGILIPIPWGCLMFLSFCVNLPT